MDNIYCEPTKAQDALHQICDYLLGEDWHVVDPIGVEQVNTCIVEAIKHKYKRKFN